MTLYLAIGFDQKGKYPSAPRSRHNVAGYRFKTAEYVALNKALGHKVHLIPRSRATYNYVTITPDSSWYEDQTCIITPIEENLLPTLEIFTKATFNPRLYLWREGQWWKFPQKEEYETGEKETRNYTSRAIFGGDTNTTTYTVDKYATRITNYTSIQLKLNPPPGATPATTTSATTPTSTSKAINPAGYPVTIQGNKMILEWKRGYENRPPIWWLRDEVKVPKVLSATMRHYDTLSTTPNARWSKPKHAWYYTGGEEPPKLWLEMIGYQTTPQQPPKTNKLPHQPDDDTGLELMPTWLREQIQAGKLTEKSGDKMIYAKWFTPDGDWYFFVREYDARNHEAYGYAILNGNLDFAEWGYQSITALEKDPRMRGQFNLPVERDSSFQPKPFKDALNEWKQARGLPIEAEQTPKLQTAHIRSALPEMPAELTALIEKAIAEDEAVDLMPLSLIEANYQTGDWNKGNPEVWAKLYNQHAGWTFFVYTASITERSLYGFNLQLAPPQNPTPIASGEWQTMAIPELHQASPHVRRDLNFIRQSLQTAVEQVTNEAGIAPPNLGDLNRTQANPSSSRFSTHFNQQKRTHETYTKRQERLRREKEEHEQKKAALAEAMKPYHEFHNQLQTTQRITEIAHHLTYNLNPRLALPAQIILLDDPWS